MGLVWGWYRLVSGGGGGGGDGGGADGGGRIKRMKFDKNEGKLTGHTSQSGIVTKVQKSYNIRLNFYFLRQPKQQVCAAEIVELVVLE
ncbi:hypothetical protein M0802_004344 [Mischocyttarus mexicanus]|nr:hypothetical protein M0802_004344 [Mischocyttarus mexicanus]